uniref:Methyltransferase n=1 Tax=Marseillevirus LCMAC101 TaxID=2506602 RepID=A0A481YR48_9VIRU|nr:MAG: hypothetical protein LCMAC101_02330 [Marseillevirus LCMAC101]
MENDYDNSIGFWIKNAPYLWVQGKTLYDSKRFYITRGRAVFDQENYILDPDFIELALIDRKLNLEETFSLIPIKEKECQIVRDYFLAWTFSSQFATTKLKFSYENTNVIFPWTNNPDIRIEGKKIGKNIPNDIWLIGQGGTLEIINHNPPFRRKITAFPKEFGNIHSTSHPGWIEGEIEYHSENKKTKHFHNILEVQQEFGLSSRELKKIHIEALHNLLADLYIKKKELESKLEGRATRPYEDDHLSDIKRNIGYVSEELKDLGEKPRKDGRLQYGWAYTSPYNGYVIKPIRILYDIASGKTPIYPVRDPVTGKKYRIPEICYISSPLKDWIGADKYYQDRNRKWEFNLPDKDGYQELCLLSHETQKLLDANMRMMKSKYSDGEINRIIREGIEIYDRKLALKKGVTWSQDDYSHLGLQREYLRYKSIQRFTETWEMLRRANNLGLLRKITDDRTPRTIRVCTMAGGPGFELYAVQRFFHKYYPYIKVVGASLDLEESWRPYAELLGFRFKPWNTSDGRHFIQKCGGKIDLAIVSYSLHMYMSGDEHIKWLSDAIWSGDIPLLFVNSRMKNLQDHKNRMSNSSIANTLLIDQTIRRGGREMVMRDDRQMVYHSPKLKIKPPSSKIKTMFPNVPYT